MYPDRVSDPLDPSPDPAPAEPPAAPAPRSTRRRFLRRALGGGALLLGGLTLHQSLGYGDAPFALQALSDKEARVALAAAARVLDGLAPEVQLEAVRWLDGYLARQSDELRRELRALLHLVEHSPPLLLRRLSRFTRLGPEAQDAHLRAFTESGNALLRQGGRGLKALLFMGAYGQPATWDAIGYGGPLPLPARPR